MWATPSFIFVGAAKRLEHSSFFFFIFPFQTVWFLLLFVSSWQHEMHIICCRWWCERGKQYMRACCSAYIFPLPAYEHTHSTMYCIPTKTIQSQLDDVVYERHSKQRNDWICVVFVVIFVLVALPTDFVECGEIPNHSGSVFVFKYARHSLAYVKLMRREALVIRGEYKLYISLQRLTLIFFGT